ncbi:hypothetical protein BU15DRAFT_74081 [Melanogaster broomeanus]|nr:hypothetical protein BU15DRAFT_74081 [Melanogaster broomeanus]
MSFDPFQQVFAVSICSNIVNDQKGTEDTLQQALQGALAYQLPTYGDWTTVWGPFHLPRRVRLPFLCRCRSPALLPLLSYAWIQENFAVDSVVNFVTWARDGITNLPERVMPKDIVAGTPYAAMGTANGAGKTLIDFLANLPDGTRIVFSRAQSWWALSPTLALSLVKSGIIPQSVSVDIPIRWSEPREQGVRQPLCFHIPRTALTRVSEAGGYQVWNLNVVNSKDIVPQSWCAIKALSPELNLDNIPTIYWPSSTPTYAGSGAIYIPLQSHIVSGFPPQAPPANLEEFLTIALLQHGAFYSGLTGVSLPTLPESELASLGLVKKTKESSGTNILPSATSNHTLEAALKSDGQPTTEGLANVDGGAGAIIRALYAPASI